MGKNFKEILKKVVNPRNLRVGSLAVYQEYGRHLYSTSQTKYFFVLTELSDQNIAERVAKLTGNPTSPGWLPTVITHLLRGQEHLPIATDKATMRLWASRYHHSEHRMGNKDVNKTYAEARSDTTQRLKEKLSLSPLPKAYYTQQLLKLTQPQFGV